MGEKFIVIGNSCFDHNFKIGQTVELIKVYEDGVFEVRGECFNTVGNQDVHPCDLKEIFEEISDPTAESK